MKNFKCISIPFAAIILGIGITSCSKNDDNNDDKQEKIEVAEKGKSLNLNTGDTVKLTVTGLSSSLKEYSLYVGDLQINYTKYYGEESNNVQFRINKNLSGIVDKMVTFRYEGAVVAEGPSLSVKKTYMPNIGTASFGSLDGSPMCIGPDNTVYIFLYFDFNPPTIIINSALFKGEFLQAGRLIMERSSLYMDISSIEIPNGKWGFAMGPKNWLGMTNRDGIIYICGLYEQTTNSPNGKPVPYFCILMRDKNGQVKPFGGDIERYRFTDGLLHICIDSKGILYVVEWSKNCIYKLDPSKQEWKTLWAGSETESTSKDGTGANAGFSTINYLTIDSNDNLYVAESSKIRKITPDGKVTTLAGKDEAGDVVGDIKNALFNKIKGMAIGKDNTIYILDGDNKVLKLINPEQTKVLAYTIRDSWNGSFVFGNKGIEMPMQVGTDGIVYIVSQQDLVAIVPDNLWPE